MSSPGELVTDRFTVIDCAQAFSRGLNTKSNNNYQLRNGEFNVCQPYYTASSLTTTKNLAGQKRKRGHDSEAHTAEWHETNAKPFLSPILSVIKELNFQNEDEQKEEEELNNDNDNDPGDPINFPSLIELAQASQRFFLHDEHVELDLTMEEEKEATTMEILDVFHKVIRNPSVDYCTMLKLDNSNYLIPPRSAFLMSDLTTGMADLVSYVEQAGKRDLIVMDPPWPNKSVRRSSKYETQDIYDLFQIPIPELLAPQGMVAVWVTNKPKFRRFIIDKLFKSWGLQEVGIWYWLKVTTQKEPVIPFESPHRKPYEQLIFGIRATDINSNNKNSTKISLLPRQHAIISVPCRRHSRKPPLDTILEPYLPDDPKCLELFARCLTPGWTSWGNECLKFQHDRFFRPITPSFTTTTTTLIKIHDMIIAKPIPTMADISIRSNGPSWRVLGSIGLLTLIVLGFIVDSFLHHQRDVQSCAMSYSRPSYIPITPGPNSRLANKYSLYLFRETIYDNPNESKSVPALFIPGHAGSYKQVRSIAATSSSYYKQKKLNGERIDYFAVDLNEEFSAISGQLLFDQAEYLNDAIEKILSLYDSSRTSSVLIVGHSMGGIVARLMLTLPNYRPNTINTILTLATPHTMPPIVLGPKMARVYDQISFSSTVFNNNNKNITLISLAGGTSDSIVNSDSAILPASKERLTAFSTAIPKVWTSCDHMAILWCNQLVRVVAAALVDSVQQQQQSQYLIKPIQIFEQHFIHPSLNFPRLPVDKPIVKEATEILFKNLDITSDIPQLTVLSIPEDRIGNTSVFNLITNDSQGSVRVFLCRGSKCITDITSMIKLLPSSTSGDHHAAYHGKHPFRFLHLEQQHMEDYDHVGVWRYEKNNPQTFIAARIDQESTTNIIVNKSNWDLVTQNGVSFNITAPQLYMTVQFPKISNPLLTYKLTLQWIKDLSDHQEEQEFLFAPIVQQNIGGESKYHVGLDEDNVSIDINFHASGDDNDTNFLQLQFWKLPGKVHGRGHLQIDWYGSLGKIVLRYGPSVVMFSFIMVLAIVANENMDFIYPLIGLVTLTSISSLVFGVPRGFTFWWLPSVFLCLGAGVLSLIWIIVYSLASILGIFISNRLASYMTSMTVKRIILACSLASIRIIPVPVIITIIYTYWLFIVAAGSNNCTINHNNKIILMFFSSLLPYVIPEVVVYIRDLIIVGWKIPLLSLVSVLDDIPMLSIVLLLVTCTHDMLSSRQAKCVLYVAIIYYTLFGYTQPYPLHILIQKYISASVHGSDN